MSHREQAQQELSVLLVKGKALVKALKDEDASFYFDYQTWYTQAVCVVEIALPDRVAEFRRYYEIDPKRKELSYSSYVIQDFCKNIVPAGYAYREFNSISSASTCLVNQIGILQSVNARLDSIIGNIHQSLLADVRDRELETAQNLLKVSVRAAGALAGVVLERHLQEVTKTHQLTFRKKHPTLSDYSEALKKANVIDVPAWRKLGYLADMRNNCCHSKGDDPTGDQARELLEGVNWALKTVF